MLAALYTLGCKVNHFETAAMEELLTASGFSIVSFDEVADVYIVNTCTVTLTADKKSRQAISRAHVLNPTAPIIAVGCYSEISREIVLSLPGVKAVLGTEGRKQIVSVVKKALETDDVVEIEHISPFKRTEFEELSAVSDTRTRATLKIQDGCNRFCTYCAIPFARGTMRSRPLDNCLRELNALKNKGYLEAVLTGIELSLYGNDLKGTTLLDLLKQCSLCAPMRIRLGSLDPCIVTEEFADVCASLPNLCRQFHLALQSGSATVLQRMKRGYSPAQYQKAVRLLKSRMPLAGITTDVIVGFPGETDAEFEETKEFVKEIGFSRLHVFPYSRRPGTKADSMPGQLTKAIKEARANELIRIGNSLEEDFIDNNLNSVLDVLAEDDGTGYSGNYIKVKTLAPSGTIVPIKITGRISNIAIGEEI